MIARLLKILAPAPAVPPITDPQRIESERQYWRRRVLYASLIGYAVFYLVRKNLPVAMPVMGRELGITKADLGLFLTLHGLLYGVSKFVNGYLGDQTNARYFMALGLLLSAVANFCFGLSSAVITLGLFWMLNGWVQGMGFPPCARILTHWFTPQERATKFSIWNTSHSIGAAAALLLCTYLVTINWRLCFIGPATIGLLGTLFLVNRLRDTPASLGLPADLQTPDVPRPAVAATTQEPAFKQFVVRHVFLNPLVWVVSAANFFVYTVRYAVLDWGPTLLVESKHTALTHAGWTIAGYELAGIAGMLASGWITDRLFKGRAGRSCFASMMLCTLCVGLLWKLPAGHPGLNTLLLCATGFFIYGPQCLVGVIAANLATRRAAATAIGLTGLFGYLSTTLSGWGLGRMADRSGWDPVFGTLLLAGVVATVLFAVCWNARHQEVPSAEGE